MRSRLPIIAIVGAASGSIVKLQVPRVRPPCPSVTAPLAATGKLAEAMPGAASASAAGGPPETVSASSNPSASP